MSGCWLAFINCNLVKYARIKRKTFTTLGFKKKIIITLISVSIFVTITFITTISHVHKKPLPTSSPIFHRSRKSPSPILTLFTTIKVSPAKETIFHNTLHNWAKLAASGSINIIFYTNTSSTEPMDTAIIELAAKLGWIIRDVPVYRHNIPVLRYMYMDAMNASYTSYYGYSNSDILFTSSLTQTLRGLYDYQLPTMLLTGRRTNVNITKLPKDLKDNDRLKLEEIAKNGSLFMAQAQDYFITSRYGFPWQRIPNFVVGRVAYDNWLLAYSILHDIALIDLTKTVLAVHQTDSAGNFEGATKPTMHRYSNNDLVPGNFLYDLGKTSCSHFYTNSSDDKIILTPRKRNGCHHMYKWKRKNVNYFATSITEDDNRSRITHFLKSIFRF